MQHDLRLIETKDTEGNQVLILTNDFRESAEEIGDIYRYRWQIEIFFKWIKQHLTVKHLYSTGYQAVENQILHGSHHLLLAGAVKDRNRFNGIAARTIQRLLKTCLSNPLTPFSVSSSKRSENQKAGER